MTIKYHNIDNLTIAEIASEDIIIKTVEDGLDLLGSLYYQGANSIIIRERNLTAAFFNLRTGLAGEILQKFSNYRVRLAIVGDFEKYSSKSIQEFFYESNKNRQINFVKTVSNAITILSKN